MPLLKVSLELVTPDGLEKTRMVELSGREKKFGYIFSRLDTTDEVTDGLTDRQTDTDRWLVQRLRIALRSKKLRIRHNFFSADIRSRYYTCICHTAVLRLDKNFVGRHVGPIKNFVGRHVGRQIGVNCCSLSTSLFTSADVFVSADKNFLSGLQQIGQCEQCLTALQFPALRQPSLVCLQVSAT